MSDVQRWDMNHVQGEVYIDKKPEGSWVTYADHLAAVAAAEQRVRDELPPNGADALWYLLGQRKGVQAARDAAAPFCKCGHAEGEHVGCTLAAIDALEKP